MNQEKYKPSFTRMTEEQFDDWMNGVPLPFVYAGGYTGSEGKVKVKCLICGDEFERSVISLRHVKNGIAELRCYSCRHMQAEERKQKERQKKIAKKQRIREEREKDRESNKLTRFCAICGKQFNTFRKRQVCCSPECSKLRNNRMSTFRSDHRIADNQIKDRDINLHDLFIRDSGKCYICGGQCNWTDMKMNGNTYIAGNYYPSVDHVVPIVKGGLHSWENVRLAHRICNSIKSKDERSSPRGSPI